MQTSTSPARVAETVAAPAAGHGAGGPRSRAPLAATVLAVVGQPGVRVEHARSRRGARRPRARRRQRRRRHRPRPAGAAHVVGLVAGACARPRRRAHAGAHAQPARRSRAARRRGRRGGRGRHGDRRPRAHARPAPTWCSRWRGRRSRRVLVYGVGSGPRSRPGEADPIRLVLAGSAVTAVLMTYVEGVIITDPPAFADLPRLAVRVDRGPGRRRPRRSSDPCCSPAWCSRGARTPAQRAGARRRLQPLARARRPPHPAARRAARSHAVRRRHRAGRADRASSGSRCRTSRACWSASTSGWVLATSMPLGAVLVLGADTVGRVLGRPGEISVGIVTAALGGPVFVALVRRGRIPRL